MVDDTLTIDALITNGDRKTACNASAAAGHPGFIAAYTCDTADCPRFIVACRPTCATVGHSRFTVAHTCDAAGPP